MTVAKTTIVCAFATALLVAYSAGAQCEELSTESVTIKMVLRNYQVKAVRKGKGQIVSIKLTRAQKRLIRGRAHKFKGLTIRMSTAHLRKGSNKIDLLLLRPSSTTPILRVLAPVDNHPKPNPD
jgi:phosphomannomutase